ncbi:DUF2599 domain-containing protein [Flexivirga caeni]|uniref:DUF2599 domain-containing protein n=2 Tax=Flexivirga caeni TaxID=2294115 RepID=A0A3M9M325_9MICO|nr:DUF2599 domain-containing protein [Flexivirga caeni]
MTLLLLGAVTACGAAGHSPGIDPDASAISASAATTAGPTSPTARSHTGGSAPTASADAPAPYILKAVWVSLPSGRSLQVYPTANGRSTQAPGAESEAWHEVLRLAPNAGTPGMRAQFECHWEFARIADPGKRSWNLEPWRPVVSAQQLYDARCNPGGPDV